jgi:hypothetical protein
MSCLPYLCIVEEVCLLSIMLPKEKPLSTFKVRQKYEGNMKLIKKNLIRHKAQPEAMHKLKK